MIRDRALELLLLCRSVDQGSALLYERFSRLAQSASVSAFWAQMAEEEAAHTRLWTELIDSRAYETQGIVPVNLLSPELARELEAARVTVASILAGDRRCDGDDDVVRCFLVASRLELLMMSPVFRLMLTRGGDHAAGSAEPGYAHHFVEFIDAMAVHCPSRPEATLTVEVLRQYVRGSADLVATLSARSKLPALVPICAWCKRVRVHGDDWTPVEEFLSAEVGAECTHGLCPECGREHFSERPVVSGGD